MPKIVPHLWFGADVQAVAEFYLDAIGSGVIHWSSSLQGTPSGECQIVSLQLRELDLMLLGCPPIAKMTPSISFIVECSSAEEVDGIWDKLSPDSTVMMALDHYPWSERYGWLCDKYGLSWQIMHTLKGQNRVVPTLMFSDDQCAKAESAIETYTGLFANSGLDYVARYEDGEAPNKAGTIKHAGFRLEGQAFAAMDSAYPHGFGFNEALSLMVHCDSQEEVDHFWAGLSAHPQAEMCGWLRDQFGVSWQIYPTRMGEMLRQGDEAAKARLTEAFLKMKKFDIAQLEKAYRG